MNSTEELPEKIEAPESTSAPADPAHKFDEPASIEHFERASDQRRPVEDLHSLLLRISHHLDYETSERSTIYYRLLALDAQTKRIENQTKRQALRALARYLIAICVGVAGVLVWQSYGEETKQFVAMRAPELGWSPEAKQMIAGWIQQIGWTKPLADSEIAAVRSQSPEMPQATNVALTSPETSAPKAPVAPAIYPEQVQQITRNLTTLQQSVEQLAAGQDQMAREIAKLQAGDSEILQKIPAPPPPPQHPVIAPAHKPTPPPPARTPAR